MKIARLGPVGQEVPVLLHDGRYLDLRPVTPDIDGAFLASEGIARVRGSVESLNKLAGADRLRLGAPIARPGAVFCIGANYARHAAESGLAPPEVPILFLKAPNSVVGPEDDVAIPRGSHKTDWEVELGIVIGRRAHYLESTDVSLDFVAGYVTANDLSERAFQLEESGGQWSKGKISPGFTPLGPWLVTADEVDPQGLGLRSFVNGEARQNSSTADQIFDCAFLVHHLSQYVVLDPGDLILTGTPEGVALSGRFPYLEAGDVVEVEIDQLGRQRQRMCTWDEKVKP